MTDVLDGLPVITLPELNYALLKEAHENNSLKLHYYRFIRLHAAHFDTFNIPIDSILRGAAWTAYVRLIVETYPTFMEPITVKNPTGCVRTLFSTKKKGSKKNTEN